MVTVTSCLGNSHTDIGMCESKHPTMHGAFEVAMKGAVSDAKKRALKCFGDALGNSLCKPEYRKAHQAYLKRQKMENARKAKETRIKAAKEQKQRYAYYVCRNVGSSIAEPSAASTSGCLRTLLPFI